MADSSQQAYTSPNISENSLRFDIENDLKGLVRGETDAISHLVDLNMSLFNKLSETELNFKSALEAIHATEERLGSLTREMDNLRYENGLLTSKLAEVDDSTRQLNLRVEGLLETANENIKDNVANCLSRSGYTCTANDLDYAKRIGKYREGQTRPILVRFIREGLRNAILFGKNNISRNSTPPVWVNDDVSDITRKQRKRTRDVAYLARLNGITDVKIHSDGIIIGNEKYHHSDLDLLPPNLSTQKATTRTEDEDIFFQGEESPFSNFYPATIVDHEGRIFFSAEQLYQYRRALNNGKVLIASKMLKTRSNMELKRLARKVQPSNEWYRDEESVMADILMLKFTQNKDLGKKLIKTGQSQLHEATGNRKWAVGFDISSKGLTEKEWRGGDLLGQLLESTREAIKAMYDVPPTATTMPVSTLSHHEQEGIDYSTIPLPTDGDEEEASDYEECEPEIDNNHNTSPTLAEDHSTNPSIPPNNPQVQSSLGSDDQTTTGSSPRVSAPSNAHVSPRQVEVAGVTQRKPRNPFRPAQQKSPRGQFSRLDRASSDSTAQYYNSSPLQQRQLDQNFDISGQQFSSRESAKRSTRRANRSRSQVQAK